MFHSLLTLIRSYLLVFPLVFLAGLVDAIAGGGGLISLPAYLLAGLPPHLAIATNKMSSCMGTSLSTWRYTRSGYVHLQTALFSIPLAFLGSWAGANLNLMISNEVFQILLLIILPATALLVFRTKRLETQREPYPLKKTCLISGIVAFGVGVYDGFYGPGTGTFLILLLTLVAHLSLSDANGLTKVINLSTNISSLAVYLIHGQVLIPLGFLAGLCNILGNAIGVHYFNEKGAKIVKPVMLLVLLLFLGRTIYELFF